MKAGVSGAAAVGGGGQMDVAKRAGCVILNMHTERCRSGWWLCRRAYVRATGVNFLHSWAAQAWKSVVYFWQGQSSAAALQDAHVLKRLLQCCSLRSFQSLDSAMKSAGVNNKQRQSHSDFSAVVIQAVSRSPDESHKAAFSLNMSPDM